MKSSHARLTEIINKTENVNNLDKKLLEIPHGNQETINKRIIDIVNKTNNVNNLSKTNNITNEQVNNIKKKFKELSSYVLAKSKDIKVNATIRYYNLTEPNKISISGIITNIEYYSIINNNNIKTIYLYNRWTNPTTSWAISYSSSYILFIKKFALSKAEKLIRDIFYTNIDNDLDESNSSNNEDSMNEYEKMFINEIEKYKKNT